MKKILVAVTGASAMLYLQSFLEMLALEDVIVHGICSEAGEKVLELEHNCGSGDLPAVGRWFDCHDYAAAPASGSAGYDAMIVVPCSMGTLAAIASGITSNLIHRAADVMLKESKQLILVTRETPLNRTHLKNMLAAHDGGATICPPHPGFYLKPENLTDAAMTFSWRLGDQLGLIMKGRKRWGDEE
ncbi:MAG: UbiX family flavin prenyltransferase [Thermodesulfobacteriota bacterium]|nr:UbiX family flavin prenyltransferase [Thermodesulfobacteriota bacterium]